MPQAKDLVGTFPRDHRAWIPWAQDPDVMESAGGRSFLGDGCNVLPTSHQNRVIARLSSEASRISPWGQRSVRNKSLKRKMVVVVEVG